MVKAVLVTVSALLAVSACGTAPEQAPVAGSTSFPRPSETYRDDPFCRDAKNVLNYRPDSVADPAKTAEFAREHARGWRDLAKKAPTENSGVFIDVSDALVEAGEAYAAAAAAGLKATEAELERSRETSFRLVEAWDAASLAIESQCGWPATDDDRLDLPDGPIAERNES